MESLHRNEVELCPNTRVLEITDSGVTVESEGQQRTIPADMVVLAIGSRSNAALAGELSRNFRVSVVGDAATVGKALDGIDAAYRTALSL